MTTILDLPDELLLKIIAWVPYRPRSHYQLELVCRRFHLVMQTEILPGMVAWYQFAPFMRILEGYRGRVSTKLSKAELLQSWQSVTRHRDWMSFLRDATRLDKNDCLTAVSIIHVIAGANLILMGRHCVNVKDAKLSFMFLPRFVRCLPPFVILLLRYIIEWTMQDTQERHIPYDQLQHLNEPGLPDTPDGGLLLPDSAGYGRQAKLFLLNCVQESTSMLLDTYRPMYNYLADQESYARWMRLNSVSVIYIARCLEHRNQSSQYCRSLKPVMGCFALHARLVELSQEGTILHPVDPEVDSTLDRPNRLAFEYTRMQKIDDQIHQQFSDTEWASMMIRSLDLEAIGRSLKDAFDELRATKTEDVFSRVGERHCEMYTLDRWGIGNMPRNYADPQT